MLHFTDKPTQMITQGHERVPDRRSGSPTRCALPVRFPVDG